MVVEKMISDKNKGTLRKDKIYIFRDKLKLNEILS